MRMFVSCSDVYANLIEPHSKLVKKYWPGLEVVFIGFTDAGYSLEDGHSFVSAGEDEGPQSFSNSLIKVFSEIDDEYFIFNLEDMILMKPPHWHYIQVAEDEIKRGADKVMLYGWNPAWSTRVNETLVKVNADSPYRASIHPAIWRREYFLDKLKPNTTLWAFELQGGSVNDGAEIYAANVIIKERLADYRSEQPYNLLHVYRGSVVTQENIDLLPEEDRDIIEPYLI